ncbi:hypothetical protein ACFFMR_18430 [Micromonospora andamanensis]|uniref:Thiocillin family RiPP n=1 Tax=Micromonospora andamanensis TaxID=1287068 RepID=A0ABQ4I2I5_9ACTN|nr:hypothetical protein [Micromonospora andamanensis]GIJ12071.1 hypothetical protein Van01_52850 [Micromonospora andamanensis]GIJ42362.1 hypothetical protein Vwe01_56870 [Micromonospora andamanensis]
MSPTPNHLVADEAVEFIALDGGPQLDSIFEEEFSLSPDEIVAGGSSGSVSTCGSSVCTFGYSPTEQVGDPIAYVTSPAEM